MKRFRQLSDDPQQAMHTFRELVLGAYLSSTGFYVKFEYEVGSLTPDWSILSQDEEEILGIIEVVNFHIDSVSEVSIDRLLEAKKMAVLWRDGNKDNVARLYQCIWSKARSYKQMTKKLEIPYVIGIFPDFIAAVDIEEVKLCVLDSDSGLFHKYPNLSGIIYFEESFGIYGFQFIENPIACSKIKIPDGTLAIRAA
jgi:hypothetical protein